jgi:hypothetical protein
LLLYVGGWRGFCVLAFLSRRSDIIVFDAFAIFIVRLSGLPFALLGAALEEIFRPIPREEDEARVEART